VGAGGGRLAHGEAEREGRRAREGGSTTTAAAIEMCARLSTMTATSTVVMYGLMYLNVYL
jgi:hypothetical protein